MREAFDFTALQRLSRPSNRSQEWGFVLRGRHWPNVDCV